MIVQVIKKIDTSVEFVEDPTTKAESSVQELDGSNEGTGEDVFKPCQTLRVVSGYYVESSLISTTYRIGNGDT